MKTRSLFSSELSPWEEADRDDLVSARVVFNLPVDRVFEYLVPDSLRSQLRVGQRVRVPFGRGDRPVVGFCVDLGKPERREGLKSVGGLVDPDPLIDEHMLELTHWIADRYLCTWGQVLDMAVPAGVKKQAGTREMLMLQVTPAVLTQAPDLKLSAKQAAVLDILKGAAAPLSVDDLTKAAGCGTGPITELRRKRLVEAVSRRAFTGELPPGAGGREADLVLNPDQQRVFDRIAGVIRAGRHQTFLLHGVTGSGKTEVYIRAIREVVNFGRQAIVLVPEISLTPQTIRRFESRFAGVAVLHSHLTDAERHQHWRRIARGEVQVVVGARSAVFAPTTHLGLIIIDEEHENSFKQDSVPRYHAREVAERRAQIENVPLILGSATPTLEAWRSAKCGAYELLRLPKRVVGLPMPPVVVVDVRHDPISKTGAAIGRALHTAMRHALDTQGQIILFLNLRGYSPLIWCRSCGAALKCPHCDITLTWHKEQQLARCHSCDYKVPAPSRCTACNQPGVRYLGTGTQRLEQEVRARFPQATCLRMDSDSMRQPGSHDQALEAFRRGDVQILLGTQMITKGLDFPNVTLVGVIDADTVLHQPDLRAAERTFQLIAQVAGRTGRSERGGRVLVQTSCPAEPPILLASKHDYVAFAEAELEHRRQFDKPPFQHLARVIVRGPHEPEVQAAARAMTDVCRAATAAAKLPVRILGPAPAPTAKLKANYRYHFQLAADDVAPIQALWRAASPEFGALRNVEYAIDVDPLNLR